VYRELGEDANEELVPNPCGAPMPVDLASVQWTLAVALDA
jgi:hypothetical protein